MVACAKSQLRKIYMLDKSIEAFIGFAVLLQQLICLLKSKTLWICQFSPSSSSHRLLRNISEFNTKMCFTNHHTPNTIHGFRDSVPVLKIHNFCTVLVRLRNFFSVSRPRLDIVGKDLISISLLFWYGTKRYIHRDIFLDYDKRIDIYASKYPRRMLLINPLSEN